jgi:DNA-directed RNA polymerase specialized sigma24 family protein
MFFSGVDRMTHSITCAVQDWRDGDEFGALELDRLLRAELLAFIRRHRNPRYRAPIDSEAVFNAALKSFLSGVVKDEFPRLRNRCDVRRLMMRFAGCVLKDEVRWLRTEKRDSARETDLAACLEAVACEPSPEECAMAKEYWEKFPEVVRQVDERAMDILELRLEGLNNTQIADKLGLGVRMVQKIVQRMVEAWDQWLSAENDDAAGQQHGYRDS